MHSIRSWRWAVPWLAMAACVPAHGADAGEVVACSARVFVNDSDPAGLNVRAGPGGGHPVVATLRTSTWVELTGSRGAWMRIARGIADEGEGEESVEFAGEGWVYGPLLAVDGANDGEGGGTPLRESPAADSRRLGQILADGGSGTVLGCRGEWLLLEHRPATGAVVRGWTHRDSVCINPYTVCS